MTYWILIVQIFHSSYLLAVPLIYAAMGGFFSERSGIANIALEGKLLFGAFTAAVVSYYTGSAWIGLLAAVSVNVLIASIMAFSIVYLRSNHIMVGFSINLMALGITNVLVIRLFDQHISPVLFGASVFHPLQLPWMSSLSHIPILGVIYQHGISGYTILGYGSIIAVLLTYFIAYRTKIGFYLRASGHNPYALDASGVSVYAMRFIALGFSGILTGLGGAFLSIAENSNFVSGMSAGQGYIALAALIFGGWRPFIVLWVALLFGFLSELAFQMQLHTIFGLHIPPQLVNITPFVLTILILTQVKRMKGAPEYVGRIYHRGER